MSLPPNNFFALSMILIENYKRLEGKEETKIKQQGGKLAFCSLLIDIEIIEKIIFILYDKFTLTAVLSFNFPV